MYQGFSIFSGFLHHFVLAKLAISSIIRVKSLRDCRSASCVGSFTVLHVTCPYARNASFTFIRQWLHKPLKGINPLMLAKAKSRLTILVNTDSFIGKNIRRRIFMPLLKSSGKDYKSLLKVLTH